MKLDEFDVALLNLLQQNNQATAAELSVNIPLSPSAITRRLRRLRVSGLIAHEVAVLSAAVRGKRLRAVIQVQLREHADQAAVSAFRRLIAEQPEVQTCLELSGAFDLLLLINSRDMRHFTAFADQVLGTNPSVLRYETAFVKKEWKNDSRISLRLSDLA